MRFTALGYFKWCFLLLSVIPVAAQESWPSAYRVRHFTDENGLPQNSVKAIVGDKNGFVWFATEAGLVRFDGQRFLTFDQSRLPLHSNRIRGFVPAVSNHAASRPYEFYALTETDEYLGIQKTAIAAVDTAFYNQYQKTNPLLTGPARTNSLLPALPSQNLLSPAAEPYFAFVSAERFYMWSGNKITSYNREKPVFSVSGHIRHLFLIDNKPFAIDSSGTFLQIRSDGIRNLELEGDIQNNPQNVRGSDNIRLFWNNISQQAFVYLEKHLYALTESTPGHLTTTLLLNDFDFVDLQIVAIHHNAANGHLFLGSASKGLFVIRKNEFQSLRLDEPDADNVYYAQIPNAGRSVLTAQGYMLGLNTDGEVTARRTSAFMENFSYKYSIADNKDGTFWFGIGFQLFKMRKTDQKILIRQQLPEPMKSLFVDRNGRLWIGCEHNSLYHLEQSGEKYRVVLSKKAKIGGISIIGQESAETMLLGTDAGLYRYNIKTNNLLKLKFFENMKIRSFYTTVQGTWITTYGHGFFLLNKQKLTRFPLDADRFLATSHCITEDKNGFFWITTNRGLFQVSKRQLLDYSRNSRNLVYYLYYDRSYGFGTNEFNGGCKPCSVTLRDGTVSLPSMDGLVWFSPAKIHPELPDKGLFVSSLHIDGRPTKATDTLEVPRDFELIRLNIATPYFGNSNNIQMQYSLAEEGRTRKWIPVNDDQVISISKIPYGNYKLVIRKVNGFKTNDYTFKELTLRIEPAWFESWWFRLLIAAILIGSFFIAVKWRTGYLMKKERENNLLRHYRVISQVIAAVNHDIQTPLHYIGFSLKQINSYLKKEKIGNPLITRMSEESLNTSQRLGTLTKNMLDYIKLQNKNPDSRTDTSAITLFELVSEICELFSPVATFKDIAIKNLLTRDFVVHSDRNLLSVIIHNLVDNASKVSRSEILIYTSEENGKKQLTIEDNGGGMPDELRNWLNKSYKSYEDWLRASQYPDQKGIGLVIVKDLCVLLHIEINVQPKNERTCITLTFQSADL
ncbi:sensor histidine kinase [Dyadobacter sp. CY323]|uniref:sensor histidine kinase n=1 Tax=Dyadobacter sp. CY323 TaxID=2907302 RepID=UPI001F3246DE|nr:sensor histidine kinase [Dyadobacter sp. CY323]MCE6987934.1 ATP-binding protein [Dyadobacter sp. CY323]